ncbi:hypothetical protein TNCV_98121 [Trichonephila clavipes]|nr:hypothetical protein TNCV_98121 [Trichonephila clavipes]
MSNDWTIRVSLYSAVILSQPEGRGYERIRFSYFSTIPLHICNSNSVAQQRPRVYCAHPSIRDHWLLKCMRRCPDQVVSLKRDPSTYTPKQAWYSFIDPMQ